MPRRRRRLAPWLTARAPVDPVEPVSADDALADRNLLSVFLAETPDRVYFKDRESRFLKVSRATAGFFGCETDELLGKSDFDFFSPACAQESYDAEIAIIESGEAVLDLEEQEAWPDGSVTWCLTSRMPLRDPGGAVVGTFGYSRDITARKLAEEALHEQTARLRHIVEIQRDVAAADLDLQSVMGLICERTRELTGAGAAAVWLIEGDELVIRTASGYLADWADVRLSIRDSLAGWAIENDQSALCLDVDDDPRVEAALARSAGVRSLVVVPLRHGDRVVGALQILSDRPDTFAQDDLTTLELLSVVLSSALSHAAEFEAKRDQVDALARFRTIFEGASIGITRTNLAGRNVEVNPAMERMLGYSAEELGELRFRECFHSDDVDLLVTPFKELMAGKRDSFRLEARCFRKTGELIWLGLTVVLERGVDGKPAYTVAMVEDVTERKVAEEGLRRQAALNEYQALHDALTGLPNRTLFRDRIQQAILTAEREGGGVAVLMMDLDRFKEINDTLGHHSGDALLKELAARLHDTLRANDTIARLGGDEFGVLLATEPQRAAVVQVIERLREAIERPVVVDGLPLGVEASIGVALYPDDADDVDSLVQHADVAMYTAKEENASYAFYDAESVDYDPARLTLVGELRRALDQRELVLYYQPKAALSDGTVNSVEALVRWIHPKRGLVPPDEFIPLAQQTGLIKPLTLYVLDEALAQCRAWEEVDLTLSVAVNLSTRNLLDVDFPDDVTKLLEKWEVRPDLLELEITESTMLADPVRTKLVLDRLAGLGVRLSIDDFGTGYSSLAYLKRLPVNELKIDRSFVMNMSQDDDDAVIVRSTIDLGRNLGLEVVAEGVEDEETWRALGSLGCHVAQGYYLSRPVPAEELTSWLRGRLAGEDAAFETALA
jgi:diguanylate cyclase (GGDEF)-like protein/PAS domain S-box-containing protein